MNIPNTPDYSQFTDDDLKRSLQQVEVEAKELANVKKRIVDAILNRHADKIQAALSEKDEPYGVVNVNGFEITTPKKVDWNQKELARLYKIIQDSGEYASDYIKISYDVSEASFKAWPTTIREQFVPARTVSKGNAAVKVKE